MRKGLFFLIFLLLLIVTAGCGTGNTSNELDPSKENVQEGHVIDISDSRILVVSDITKEEAIDSPQEELLSEGNEAVWYSVDDTSTYEIGELLRLEWEYMNDSYPGQSSPDNVQIMEE
ncbi:DUF3221 domain-containing protein [Salsuginibacillus kocurii]|uniref:DUF3221 domain-containing protein n=1 Tax=Salsuginibacillus kocurii TaxID=427078 RepID=UPI0003725C4D|nr:DUF3221 domain-containing protein [Salsuginibacillus kocurii]